MEQLDNIDGQMLSAFVDGLLDHEHTALVIKAMEADPEIREQVYQFRRVKDLMKLGFGNATTPSGEDQKPVTRKKYIPAIAASITFLAVSLLFGAAGYYYGGQSSAHTETVIASAAQEQTSKIILHISQSDPKQFAAALAYTDKFLAEHDSTHQIDVVAHAKGLDIMRDDVSPLKEQIVDMMEKHDNVHFIACANAIRMFRQKKGVDPVIIQGVGTDSTAFDHIVNRLQSGGWKYIKVESITGT